MKYSVKESGYLKIETSELSPPYSLDDPLISAGIANKLQNPQTFMIIHRYFTACRTMLWGSLRESQTPKTRQSWSPTHRPKRRIIFLPGITTKSVKSFIGNLAKIFKITIRLTYTTLKLIIMFPLEELKNTREEGMDGKGGRGKEKAVEQDWNIIQLLQKKMKNKKRVSCHLWKKIWQRREWMGEERRGAGTKGNE